MPDQDNELFKRICKKDHKAFEQLYKAHYKRLLVLAYRYVKNEDTAEEVVNDVLMRIWTEAPRLRIEHALKSYLSRSVINRSLNVIRQQNRLEAWQEQYQAEIAGIDTPEDQAEVLEEQLVKLESVLERLPSQCKKILIMSKFEKCRQQEIADRLNISVKTVKNQLTIGFDKIRRAISGEACVLALLLSIGFLGLLNEMPVL